MKTTADLVNVDGLNDKQKSFIRTLSKTLSYSDRFPKESILGYGRICACDDGSLCEHRLQYIADWLKNN